MLLLSVFLLGLGIFDAANFGISRFGPSYGYLVKCGTLITGVSYDLPGVFESNPFRVP